MHLKVKKHITSQLTATAKSASRYLERYAH